MWALQQIQTKTPTDMGNSVVDTDNQEKEFCLGFFQTADSAFLRAQFVDEERHNRQVMPAAIVMSASEAVAERFSKAYDLAECTESDGTLRIIGFMPLEVMLKWIAIDPAKLGRLSQKSLEAKDFGLYKRHQMFLIQIAKNFQDKDWVVVPNSTKHQFHKHVAVDGKSK